ncbi:hypothetical protein M3Y98_00491200 [Aphelenchoides besseyi]|nr:hypothetical protein M3Y98_00491200 [Aphelenchoides besseyi]KAI6207674.1 hypothetical protein M3Y96_00033900 [Aphelenchoides besseyi]
MNSNRYPIQEYWNDVQFSGLQQNAGGQFGAEKRKRGKRGGQKLRERRQMAEKFRRMTGENAGIMNNRRSSDTIGNSQLAEMNEAVKDKTEEPSTSKTAELVSPTENLSNTNEQQQELTTSNQLETENIPEYEKAKLEARKLRVKTAMSKIFEPAADEEEGAILDQNDIPDLMICGGCHLITANAQFFYEHRLRRCDRKQPGKGDGEPVAGFKCYHCDDFCKNAWHLIAHMARKHNIVLYRDSKEELTIEYPSHND